MSDKKIIAVVGATGAQGGGLVRAILEDPERRVHRAGDHARRRTRTRPASWRRWVPRSWRATSTTRRSFERAFAGAYGAYCVTFFWDHFSPDEGDGAGAGHGRGGARRRG